MKTVVYLLIGAIAGAFASGAETTVTSVAFSDPSKPGVVQIWVSQGQVMVHGDASLTQNVAVHSNIAAENSSHRRPDGLRVVSAAASFSVIEKNNVVQLDYGRDTVPTGRGASFEVRVPTATHVVVNTAYGGDVEIKNIQGDVEVKNLNGQIRLVGLAGGALIESMNGEIEATFDALAVGKPLSFTSMNGEILVRLPAKAGASVRFRTQNGSILTDFDEDALKTKAEPTALSLARKDNSRYRVEAAEVARAAAETTRAIADEVRAAVQEATQASSEAIRGENAGKLAPRAPRAPRPPSIPALAGGKVVSGILNGGGPEIQIATMNGDIVVRKVD
jgi:hypothetical protein